MPTVNSLKQAANTHFNNVMSMVNGTTQKNSEISCTRVRVPVIIIIIKKTKNGTYLFYSNVYFQDTNDMFKVLISFPYFESK